MKIKNKILGALLALSTVSIASVACTQPTQSSSNTSEAKAEVKLTDSETTTSTTDGDGTGTGGSTEAGATNSGTGSTEATSGAKSGTSTQANGEAAAQPTESEGSKPATEETQGKESEEAKEGAEKENQQDPNALSQQEQTQIEKLKLYVELLTSKPADKLIEILNQNVQSIDKQQSVSEADAKKINDAYSYFESKKEFVNVKTKEEYNAAKLDDLDNQAKNLKDAVSQYYTKYFDAQIENNLRQYSFLDNKKTTNDLKTIVEQYKNKYTSYIDRNVLEEENVAKLKERKKVLDDYYNELVVLIGDDQAAKYKDYSVVAIFPYYKDDEANSEKTNVYQIVTNLPFYKEQFDKLESVLIQLADMKTQFGKLKEWLSDVNGEAKVKELREKYGKYYDGSVEGFDQAKLEEHLKAVADFYKWAQETYKEGQDSSDAQTVKEFIEKVKSKYDIEKAKYDKAIKALEDTEQDRRKKEVDNNKKTFNSELNDFLDLYLENETNKDPKVLEALENTRRALHAARALYENLDINNEDQLNQQDLLARAYINIWGPAFYTVLPEAEWGYDLIKTLKTAVDRVWYYSNRIKNDWSKYFKSYQDALASAKAEQEAVANNEEKPSKETETEAETSSSDKEASTTTETETN